jgi:GT2 family glycosyltransferase
MPKVFIIIPHYIITEHVAELARNAVNSFKNTADCIVVNCDDCSPYDTSFLKEMPDVYIRNKENLGFAGNCNVGFNWVFENEKDDCYIVCANNDIEVYPQWFERLKQAMEMGDGAMVGGLGYKGRWVEGMKIEDYEKNPGSKFTGNYITEGGRLDDWMFPGGMFMTKKSHLMDIREEHDGKLQTFDEHFLHGGYEDIDLFLRFKEVGKRLIMTPKVAYWHEEGATRFSEEEKGRQAGAEVGNLAYFLNKWKFQPHENILSFMQDNRINL